MQESPILVHWRTIRISVQAKGVSKGRMSPQTHFQSLPSQNQVLKGGSQAGRLAYIYIYMVRATPEIYLRTFSYLEDMIKKIEEAFDIHEGSPDE